MFKAFVREVTGQQQLHKLSAKPGTSYRTYSTKPSNLPAAPPGHSTQATSSSSRRRLWLAAAATSGFGVLWACDFEAAHVKEMGASVPRFMWACGWGRTPAGTTVSACVTSNGGLYIKAAQLLSTAQSVPVQYRRELEVLQDRVPPRPVGDIEAVIERELGMPVSDAYASFEPEAKAAASLAQVHRARLHDGREVAVKVQYPGLESAVQADLTALSSLATTAAFLFPNAFEYGWLIDELQANLAKELDFSLEAANAASLSKRMRHREYVAVPAPVPQLSTSRVITMEWIEGCRVNNLDSLNEQHLWPREVALLLLHTFAEQTFAHGICHADPHPGNIIVRPQPRSPSRLVRWLRGGWRKPQLVLLDHGLYCSMPDHLRIAYCRMWCAFVMSDMATATDMAREIAGEQGAEILPKLLKPGALQRMTEQERKDLRERLGITSPKDFGRLLQLLPRELIDFMRVTSIVRGIASELGGTIHDRLRINATYALQGMAWQGQDESRLFNGGVRERTKRLQISTTIYSLRIGFWLVSSAEALWRGIKLHVFRHKPSCHIQDSDSLVSA